MRHHRPLAQIQKEDEFDLSFGKKWNHHSIKVLPSVPFLAREQAEFSFRRRYICSRKFLYAA